MKQQCTLYSTYNPHLRSSENYSYIVEGHTFVGSFITATNAAQNEAAIFVRTNQIRIAHVVAVFTPLNGWRRRAVGYFKSV